MNVIVYSPGLKMQSSFISRRGLSMLHQWAHSWNRWPICSHAEHLRLQSNPSQFVFFSEQKKTHGANKWKPFLIFHSTIFAAMKSILRCGWWFPSTQHCTFQAMIRAKIIILGWWKCPPAFQESFSPTSPQQYVILLLSISECLLGSVS